MIELGQLWQTEELIDIQWFAKFILLISPIHDFHTVRPTGNNKPRKLLSTVTRQVGNIHDVVPIHIFHFHTHNIYSLYSLNSTDNNKVLWGTNYNTCEEKLTEFHFKLSIFVFFSFLSKNHVRKLDHWMDGLTSISQSRRIALILSPSDGWLFRQSCFLGQRASFLVIMVQTSGRSSQCSRGTGEARSDTWAGNRLRNVTQLAEKRTSSIDSLIC